MAKENHESENETETYSTVAVSLRPLCLVMTLRGIGEHRGTENTENGKGTPMNDSAVNHERRPSARRRWLLLLVSLPIVLGVMAVAILGFGEYRSAREVTAEIARLRAAGEPVDNETQARWFQAGSSQEGTAAWREILVAVEQVSSGEAVNSFPIIGTGKLPEPLVPGGDWPDEPRIAEFLQEVRPLIGQIEQAGRYPTPVWQPIAFNGFSTLLPETPGIAGGHPAVAVGGPARPLSSRHGAGLARTCRNADHGRSLRVGFLHGRRSGRIGSAEYPSRCDPPVAGGNRLGAGPVGSVACAGTAPARRAGAMAPNRCGRAGDDAGLVAGQSRGSGADAAQGRPRAIPRHCC